MLYRRATRREVLHDDLKVPGVQPLQALHYVRKGVLV